jgi:D-sedoheptulose 7-phosphate isomerase
MDTRQTVITSHFQRSLEVLERAVGDAGLHATMLQIAEKTIDCFRNGGKLMLVGNGGSAADAQHIAGEFLSRLRFDRPALPAIALTTDTSVLTAVGNDYGYEQVFERQVLGLGRPGDVLIAISTSGRSPNVLAACEAARRIGVITVGFTGTKGAETMRKSCDIVLAAPTDDTPMIQQIHITAAHAICELAEGALFVNERQRASGAA